MVGKFAKGRLKRLALAIAKETIDSAPVESARNVELYVSSMLRDLDGKNDLNDPEFFVGQLRASFVPYRVEVQQIKGVQDVTDEHSVRFSRLLKTLRTAVPSLPASMACEIAKTADAYRGNTQYILHPGDPEIYGETPWAADVSWAFGIGSSFAKRGRFLYTTVRFMRPTTCIEAGSYFGMSALFILFALSCYGDQGRLHTIEASEPIFSVSSAVLKSRFGDMVTCHCGLTQNVLPSVLPEAGTVDLFFHDNGHSRDDYVRDFTVVLESLKPGSVVIYDDIRWGEGTAIDPPPRCYDGWMEVVSHPRVKRAAEIGSEMGLVLMG